MKTRKVPTKSFAMYHSQFTTKREKGRDRAGEESCFSFQCQCFNFSGVKPGVRNLGLKALDLDVALGRVPPLTEEWLKADARLADSTSTAWDMRAHLSCPVPAC